MILTLTACAAAGVVGWYARKGREKIRAARKRRAGPRPPDNQFGILVLPEIDDPRWAKGGRDCATTDEPCIRFQMVLGKVKTCPEHGVWVDGVPVLNYRDEGDGEMRQKAYAWGVRRAFQARLSMEAIEGEPLALEAEAG